MKKTALIFLLAVISLSAAAAKSTTLRVYKISPADSISMEPEIFDRAEVMPTFPGGVTELMKFIQKNIRYPELARKKKLEGKVIVKFYIDKDGSVKDPEVLKDGVGGDSAEESVRVIHSMPKWNPAMQNGNPVRCYYTLPITFKLQ